MVSDGTVQENSNMNGSLKRSHCSEDMMVGNKKCRTVVIDSDDEVELMTTSDDSHVPNKEPHTPSQAKSVDVIDVDVLPSPNLRQQNSERRDEEKYFHCTACFEPLKVSEVRKHPQLQVIVCRGCSFLVEEKMKQKVWVVRFF